MISGLPTDAVILIADTGNVLESQISRKLQQAGYSNLIPLRSQPVDLCDITQVQRVFEEKLPDCVIAVSQVNPDKSAVASTPASHLHRDLNSVLNLIYASYLYEVSKLINIVCDVDAGPSDDQGRRFSAPGPAGDLLSSVTSSLCDRYRRDYDCDFISAYFHLSTSSWHSRFPALPDTPQMSDPADTCLFLMGQVSSPGVFSFRGPLPINVA